MTAYLWIVAVFSTVLALAAVGLLIHYLWTEYQPGTVLRYMRDRERERNGKL